MSSYQLTDTKCKPLKLHLTARKQRTGLSHFYALHARSSGIILKGILPNHSGTRLQKPQHFSSHILTQGQRTVLTPSRPTSFPKLSSASQNGQKHPELLQAYTQLDARAG